MDAGRLVPRPRDVLLVGAAVGHRLPGAVLAVTSDVLASPFVPFRTTKRLGTGLGLPNVKRVAEEHGAEVLLENRPEGGARVTVVFPSAATIRA